MNTDELAEAGFAGSDSLGAGPGIAGSPWVVMKFGGSSVTSATNWQTIHRLLRKRLRDGLRPVLVQSALQGVSNALTRIAQDATRKVPLNEVAQLRAQHATLAASLGLRNGDLLDSRFDELESILHSIHEAGEATPRLQAATLAMGELMASTIGA
ncbi:MAG TPA: hypothetical protein VLB07_08320, partial [Woeseiaceae bacterium]|nr:hypothetical protein [Woeseiaceae bacterium]